MVEDRVMGEAEGAMEVVVQVMGTKVVALVVAVMEGTEGVTEVNCSAQERKMQQLV